MTSLSKVKPRNALYPSGVVNEQSQVLKDPMMKWWLAFPILMTFHTLQPLQPISSILLVVTVVSELSRATYVSGGSYCATCSRSVSIACQS